MFYGTSWLQQLIICCDALRLHVFTALLLVGSLWLVYIVSLVTGMRLNYLSVYPRRFWSLPGIFFHVFLHGDFNHLFFNSIPLVVLTDFLLMQGQAEFVRVSLIVILGSGFAIWCCGRRAFHLGASSLVMGYWSYLLLHAYRQPSMTSIILAIVCLYYFGGLLFDLFPRAEKVSWEGHLFGFAAGLLAAYC